MPLQGSTSGEQRQGEFYLGDYKGMPNNRCRVPFSVSVRV